MPSSSYVSFLPPLCPLVSFGTLSPLATAGRDRATVDRLLQAYELPIPDTDREAFVDLAAFLGINQRLVPGTRVRVRGRDAPNVPI
jgi:hypothetical protein